MIDNLPVHEGQSITIMVTNDCNLRCKYCYEVNKCDKGTISLETVKNFIEMLSDGVFTPEKGKIEGAVIDLLGGDALMYPDVCREIIDSTMKILYLKKSPLRTKIHFSLCTNGTFFTKKKVQDFLTRYKNILSVGVSIDGCPELHDKNRVDKMGNGSMSRILEGWEWYRRNFPQESTTTKSTLSKGSIPYIFQSLKYMYEELGIKYINQNFIMEEENYSDEDYTLLREEMKKCTEYVWERRDKMYWSMIDRIFSESKNDLSADRRCGTGEMPTLDIDGSIYGCQRWCPVAMKRESITLGNANNKTFDIEKRNYINSQIIVDKMTRGKCRDCDVASSCSYCPAGCFDEYGEFKRTDHICEINKIQCEFAKEYWRAYDEEHNSRQYGL